MENLRTHRSQNQFSSNDNHKIFYKPLFINVSSFDPPITPKFYKEPKFFKTNETTSFFEYTSESNDG